MDSQIQHKHSHTSSGHDIHGVHVCHKCGWPFPNPHPSAKHRRAHKKVCGTVEGYKLVVDLEGSAHSNISNDEYLSDEDHKTPTPKVLEKSGSEKGSGGAGELPNRSEDEVFSVAAAEFVDGRTVAESQGGQEDAREATIDVEKILEKESKSIQSIECGPVAEAVKPSGSTTESIQVLHSETLESTNNRLENAPEYPGPSPGSTKDVSLESEKTKAVDDDFDRSSRLAEQGTDVEGKTEACSGNSSLDTKVSPTQVAGEIAEAIEPSLAVIEDSTNYSKIPETDVRVVIATADVTEGINDANSDNLNEKGAVDANVHVLSVPEDIHEVDKPMTMLEDFKDHKGLNLHQSATLEFEKGDDITSHVIEESGQSNQSEGSAISACSHTFVKDVPVEGEADSSQIKVENTENKESDVVEAPKDVSYLASIPDTTGTVEAMHLVGEDEKEKTANPGLSGDYISITTAEGDYKENPVIAPEFAGGASGIQVKPATSFQGGDDAGIYEKVDIKDHKILDVCDASTDHVKDENGVDNGDCPAKENSLEDPVVPPESAKKFSELELDQETGLHDAGNYEKVETEKDKATGDACDATFGNLKDETVVDNSSSPTAESWAENPEVTPESANKLAETPVNPSAHLHEGNNIRDNEKGINERAIQLGTETKEELPVEPKTTPGSASYVKESETIAEGFVFGSAEKSQESACADLGVALDPKSVGVKTDSDAHLGKDKPNKNGLEVTPSSNSMDDDTKESTISPLDAKSCVQITTATDDNSAREFVAVSGLGSESFQGESDRPPLGGSVLDMSIDSSSQTDSLENNWGSVSVLSVQSDAQALIDAETVPPTESRGLVGEKTGSKHSKPSSEGQHSDKADMFEPPSFMTLVEPRGENSQNCSTSEIQTSQNPEQPKSSSLQAGWFPSITHVSNESQGRKKNEEIIAKVTNWSTGKQHTPLKSLLGEAALDTRAKSPKRKENLAPVTQKGDKPATTVNSILAPKSPSGQPADKEIRKEWDSPARYPTEIKREKRKPRGRPYWAQFMCCSSVH